MNDEDDEFVDLFDNDICYIDGGNQSGFYLVEDPLFETRLYCVEDAAAPRIFPIPLKPSSLHPKHCLILGLGFKFNKNVLKSHLLSVDVKMKPTVKIREK